MKGSKYLFKNIGLLTISQFGTKILTFLLVPLYTSILSTEEYGTYDIINTTACILVPILTLNIQEAVIRFLLEKKNNESSVISIAVRLFILSNVLLLIGILIINYFIVENNIFNKYPIYFFLLFSTTALYGIVSAYTRGIERIVDISIAGVLSSVTIIALNIIFLLVLKMGLKGYFIAHVAGTLLPTIYLILRSALIPKVRFIKLDKNVSRQMLLYSKPLIIENISWWINNVADKYIVTLICGVAINGIYAIASKIPGILNTFQMIFNQAWILSAVNDFDPEDKNSFFSKTYKTYNSFMVIGSSLIIICDKVLARLLYANEFFSAWQYVPWLTISLIFGALSGYLGGFFAAVKNTRIMALSTLIGACVNIGLNLLIIPLMGPLGAAIATFISYCIIWIIRFYKAKTIIKIRINIVKDLISYTLLIIQAILILLTDGIIMYLFELVLFACVIFLNAQDIQTIMHKGIQYISSRLRKKQKS